MLVVPIVRVPLNIMCSKKWLMPVMPGRSLTEPTRASQPTLTVGDSWRSKSSHFMPLPSVYSSTVIWGFSAAEASGAASSRARHNERLFMSLDSLSDTSLASARGPASQAERLQEPLRHVEDRHAEEHHQRHSEALRVGLGDQVARRDVERDSGGERQ